MILNLKLISILDHKPAKRFNKPIDINEAIKAFYVLMRHLSSHLCAVITVARMVEFYEKHLSKYKNKLIIMDNASSHRNPVLTELPVSTLYKR